MNVLIDRLPSGQPIGFERSRCPSCEKKLAWWELIPLLSFLLLGGRCSQCKEKISLQYPLVEFITGLSFTLVFYKFLSVSGLRFTIYDLRFTLFLNLFFWFFIVALLLAIFGTDLKHYIIPNKLVYSGIFVSFFALLGNNFTSLDTTTLIEGSKLASIGWLPSSFIALDLSSFTVHFLFAIIGAGFFLFLIILTRGKGMGVGDLKFAFLLGLVFGVYLLDIIYLAFLLGGFVGVWLLALQNRGLKSKVPFGPFLAFVSLLFVLI